MTFLSFNFSQASTTDLVEFGRSSKGRRSEQHQGNDRRGKQETQEPVSEGSGEDADIVEAVAQRRHVDYVEGRGMTVVKLFADDSSGAKHQKWMVRLTNGAMMQAVYNLDMCDRVDLEIGDVISMGGEFIWTKQGALLHWLHFDPREKRSDGYVEVDGKVYCGDGERHR